MPNASGYYERGKGKTFTPSNYASWIEEFNEMIDETNMSRNKLTEHLIEKGLEQNKIESSGTLQIPLSKSLNQTQIEFLNSPNGKAIASNLICLIFDSQLHVPEPESSNVPTFTEPVFSPEPINGIKEDGFENNSVAISEPNPYKKVQSKALEKALARKGGMKFNQT